MIVRNAMDLASALVPLMDPEKTILDLAKEAAKNPSVNENALVYTLGLRAVSGTVAEKFLAAYREAKK